MISNDFWALCYLRISVPWHKCEELVFLFIGVMLSGTQEMEVHKQRREERNPLGIGKEAFLACPSSADPRQDSHWPESLQGVEGTVSSRLVLY